ncbi:MAG: hypothetical protein ACJ789_02270 [Thermomicrobiales bacterium]
MDIEEAGDLIHGIAGVQASEGTGAEVARAGPVYPPSLPWMHILRKGL